MLLPPTKVNNIFTGTIQPLGASFTGKSKVSCLSGIDKQPLTTPAVNIKLTRLGLVGDEIAQPTHGGEERALLHVDDTTYPQLLKAFPHEDLHPTLLAPPRFGENITTSGLAAQDVCVGDVFELGTAKVQVSMPRRPCYRLNHRFSVARDLPNVAQEHCLSGWFYRVLQEGEFKVGDELIHLERPCPDLPLPKVMDIFNLRKPGVNVTREFLQRLVAEDLLAEKFKAVARQRLKTGKVEEPTWLQLPECAPPNVELATRADRQFMAVALLAIVIAVVYAFYFGPAV